MVSRFGPVKQDGICLLPPSHYRMMAPQRSDAYSVPSPAGSYVAQTQGPNQGPGLRGITPTGPPNQSSTPPNPDLKVQNLQGPMQTQMFMQNPRAQAQYFPPRSAAGPPSQTSRMPNQQHRPQGPHQIYSTSPYVLQPSTAIYIPSNQMYFNHTPRPPTGIMPAPSYAPPGYQPPLAYQTYPQQASSGVQTFAYFSQPPAMMTRTPVAPAAAAPPNTGPGNMPAAPLITPPGQSGNYQKSNQKKRRANAISIIDPNTGVDKLNEIFDENNSHPTSGESSSSQTPQPAPPNPNKEVQAAFAKQVAQAINEDRQHTLPNDQSPSLHDASLPEHFPSPPQTVPQIPVPPYDIQNSTLHYNAKEFVSSTAKPTKDSTPIVSANSDAAEVILPKKDRDSPVKGKKQGQRDPKLEPLKEPPTKEIDCDRSSSIVKEEIDLVPQTIPVTSVVITPTPVPEPPPVVKDIGPENLDKKNVKKPTQMEPKPAEPVESSPQVPVEVATSNSGKSKSSQKNKQSTNQNGKPHQTQQPQHPQQHQQQQQQQQPSLPVPTPQPPKPNNRSNKTKELNMKGANKEGTDMDAFNDNVPKTEINANVLPVNEGGIVSSNDVVNANPIPQSVTATFVHPTIEPKNIINSQQKSDTEKTDSNENVNITTINSEHIINTTPVVSTATPTPVIMKPIINKFDVTSIIRDVPKPIETFPINDSKDETDKSILQTDKMVVAKNNVNSKVSAENALNDSKSQLPYKPGQWAPDRPDGKKQYEKDFLLALRDQPASKQKPDNIPENVLLDDRKRQLDGRLSSGGRTDFNNPPFTSYNKSSTQRGTLSNRKSNPGIRGDKGSNKHPPKVTISIGGEVKLHNTENAWKPTRFGKGEAAVPEDEKKTEALYKRVRSVLNKLTPQKFDTLVNQVRKLEIDTKDRLQGVINLVFDKAIDEPSFSVAYAMMCKELQIMQVPAGSTGDDKKSVAFRTLLVTRCQSEFEKQSVDETQRNTKIKEIENCADPEKKKELSFELGEYDRRLRMKSVGCIRFIGELFKQQMLTASIMRRCLQTLLDNKDEESLECLCKLLTTVGKELESKNVDLSTIFDEMKRIVDGKRQKVSSRIRFMLQDVTELRNSKWVPRRSDTAPKTIDQIQKEAENEHLNNQVMNMNTPRKDDRGSGPRGSSQRQKVNDDGWSSVGTSRNTRNQPFTIQADKMRAARLPAADEPLGSSQLFGSWGKGAGASKISQPPVSTSTNMYAALENMDMDRRPLNSRSNKDPYSSKGPSLERNSYKSYDGRGSRSGSQHRDTGAPMRSTGPPSIAPVMTPAAVVQPKPSNAPTQPSAPPPVPKLSEEQIERRIHNSLDEYLTSCCTTDEYFEDIAGSIPQNQFSKVVYESYNYVLEKSQSARLKTGELFAKLIRTGRLPLDSFITGFEDLLSLWEDLVIDIPQIWQYFAEDLVHLCLEEVLPFDRLQKLLSSLISNNVGQKLLKPLFGLIVKEKGPNFLQNAWRNSGFQLSDFMSESEVQPFIKNNNFEFLVGGETPIGQSLLSYEEIQRKLSEFFRSKTPFDDIVNWISANVGESVKEKKFIRTLGTAIFEDSLSKNKLVPEVLMGHSKLIQKYVDTNTDYELECLYALQSLAHKLEHPQGLLLSICDKLYEDSTFSQESFIAWENSADPAEQEGKGVALKQLTSFFTQLKENEEDEDYSSNSEDA